MEHEKIKYLSLMNKRNEVKEDYEKIEKELEEIKREIENRPHLAMTVSDHALLNFLIRVLKIDVKKYKDDMLRLCDTAGEPDEQNRDGIQYVYENDGPHNTDIKLIVKNNKIVTCFIEDKNGKND